MAFLAVIQLLVNFSFTAKRWRPRKERTIRITLQWDEIFDVGSDTGTPIDDRDYQVPFPFTGKLNKVTVEEGPIKWMPARSSTASRSR